MIRFIIDAIGDNWPMFLITYVYFVWLAYEQSQAINYESKSDAL